MNLIDGGFQHSNIFTPLPLFDEITYDGYLAAKIPAKQNTRAGLVNALPLK
jgi:hypothetical protein